MSNYITLESAVKVAESLADAAKWRTLHTVAQEAHKVANTYGASGLESCTLIAEAFEQFARALDKRAQV